MTLTMQSPRSEDGIPQFIPPQSTHPEAATSELGVNRESTMALEEVTPPAT